MLIMLNESFTSSDSAACSTSGEISTSVVINTSMVAILGCIIPEPFAMPPITQSVFPILKLTAVSFKTVSVVIMPSAAAVLPS